MIKFGMMCVGHFVHSADRGARKFTGGRMEIRAEL